MGIDTFATKVEPRALAERVWAFAAQKAGSGMHSMLRSMPVTFLASVRPASGVMRLSGGQMGHKRDRTSWLAGMKLLADNPRAWIEDA